MQPVPSPQKSKAGLAKLSSPAIQLALLLSVTAIVFSPVLFADFIRLDDYSHLFNNPNLQQGSASGLAALWTRAYFNLYIPVTYTVWWLTATLGRQWGEFAQMAWLFHALGFAIHLINVAQVSFLLHTLLDLGRPQRNRSAAQNATLVLLATAFFALHPVQMETVAWISELKGELAAMFGLLALLLHYRWSKRLLAAVCLTAAMLSKPSAVVFPAVVLLVDRILLGKSIGKSAIMPAWYGLPLLALAVVTKHLQPDSKLDFVPSAAERLLVAADAFAFYVQKILVPFPLAVDYGRSPRFVLDHISAWQLALSILVLATGVAVVLRALIRPRGQSQGADWLSWLSLGWSIFLVSLVPVLGVVSFGFQNFSTVADHYLYLPLIGISVMVAGVLIRLGSAAWSRSVAAALLLGFAILSARQARLWNSTISLFSHTVEVNPRSYLGCYCIAEEYLHTRHLDESQKWLLRSLSLNPNYLNSVIDLGMVQARSGEISKAIELYTKVLAKNPSTVGARAKLVSSIHNNLGMLLLQVGRRRQGIEHIRKAVELFPRSVNGHLNLGNVAMDERRYSDAVSEYEMAQSLSPGNPAIERRLDRARQMAKWQRGAPRSSF